MKALKIFEKKEKRYPFNPIGYAQMMLDIKQEKLAKVNSVVSIVVILGMFALGFLSKEFLVMILTTKCVGKVASALVG